MLKQIILKEVLDHIQKLRFFLTGMATILLFIISSYSFISEYEHLISEYKSPEQLIESISKNSNLSLGAFVQRSIQVRTSPQSIWFCVSGKYHNIPNQFFIGSFWNQEVKTAFFHSRENPWLQRLFNLDWILITAILLSFTVVVLSYDVFNSEKLEGTLRLILSNSIPRHVVLFGKFFGVFLTVLIPLMIGQLLSLVLIQFSEVIQLSSQDWIKIGLIIVFSWIYLAIIIFLCKILNNSQYD